MRRDKVVFLNDKKEIVDKKDATSAIVTQYDENGKMICEKFFNIVPRDKEEDKFDLSNIIPPEKREEFEEYSRHIMELVEKGRVK